MHRAHQNDMDLLQHTSAQAHRSFHAGTSEDTPVTADPAIARTNSGRRPIVRRCPTNHDVQAHSYSLSSDANDSRFQSPTSVDDGPLSTSAYSKGHRWAAAAAFRPRTRPGQS